MPITIEPLFPSDTFCIIHLDRQMPAPAKNVKRWLSTYEHSFKDGKRFQLLITWTSCPDFPNTYEPIAEINEDGSVLKYLAGTLQPDMNYKINTTQQELEESIKAITLLNPENNELFQLPYYGMCISETITNMISDLGSLDDTPLPIGSNIINGTTINTLRLLQMFQIIGNPQFGNALITNWTNEDIAAIDITIRSPHLDAIIKAPPATDETTQELEIGAAIGNPNFKFKKGWTDQVALNYYVSAAEFFNIQILTMYICHAYADKMSNI